jgi:hypothetical protein
MPYELILKGLRQITGKEDISQKIDFPPEKIFCGICLSGIYVIRDTPPGCSSVQPQGC